VNLSITLEQPSKKLALFGSADRHLRLLRDAFGVQVVNREDELRVAGETDQVAKAAKVLDQLQRKLRKQDWLTTQEVEQAIGLASGIDQAPAGERIETFAKGQAVKAKTQGQAKYLAAIGENDLTICCGPAGTGKTYLAVAAAASPAVNTVQAVVSGDTAHVTAPVAATLSDIASNPAVADITHTAQSDIGAVLTTPVTTDVANAVNIVAAATSPVTDTAQAIASGDINPVTAPVTAALGDITSNPTVTDITHTAQSDVSAALTTPVTTDVSNVVNTVAAATNPITDAMQTIASGDTAPVTAPVAAVAGELANTITSDVGALGTVIAPVTSGATETVANTAANALSTASNTADAATTTIIGAAQPVGDTASTTLTSLGNDLHTINTVDIAPPVAATVPVASSLLSNVAAETTNAAATTTTDTHDALTNLASLAHADTAVPPVDAGVLFTGGAAGSLSTSTPAPAATHDTAIDHATHHGLL